MDTVGPAEAAVAKVVCSEAAEHLSAEMIQLHGGIAITWEHDAQLYFKRAHGSAQLFGSVAETIASVDWLSVRRDRPGDQDPMSASAPG